LLEWFLSYFGFGFGFGFGYSFIEVSEIGAIYCSILQVQLHAMIFALLGDLYFQVFRNEKWQQMSTEDLLPGDLISVKYHHVQAPEAAVTAASGSKKEEKQEEASNIIPCDCLLLTGTAVVNEASLTGESVPQMKDSLRS
jgi:magnesium-transporting ATPase (P-type)